MLTDERSGVRSGVRVADVREVEEPLRALLSRLEPDEVFVFDAPDLWAAFDSVERLATSAKTLLARRVEAASTWQSAGFHSAAEQLASLSGTTVAAARSALVTSKQVADLPATADVLRSGVLSAGKVEAIASAATVAPDAEARLLSGAARKPLAEVRNECLAARAGVDRDAAHDRIRRERRLKEFSDPEGAWNIRGRGPLEAGAFVRSVLDPIVDEMFKQARADGRKEPREAYAFDALVELARRASGSGSDVGAGKKPSPRFLGLIRVDHEALRRGSVEGDEVCEISGLGPIPVRVARDLLGDAILKVVITKGVDVANVTHLGRSPTVAQQVALLWRSPICEIEDCVRTQRLEKDHGPDWAETHHTRLDELKHLCGHHHWLKTVLGWAIVAGTGGPVMVAPDDRRHPRYRAPPGP